MNHKNEMKFRYICFGLYVCFIFGIFLIGAAKSEPNITAYNNSISDDTLYPHVQSGGSIRFNVTVNESVNYTWVKDGSSGSNNFDNYTTSWTGPGQKNVTVFGTNSNGSTEQLTWNPLVEQEMAGAGDTITELNMTPYNSILDVVSSEDPDYEDFLYALTMPHTSIIGSLFYVVLYGVPFIVMWVSQGSSKIPAVLGCMLGPALLGAFNPEYINISVLFIIIALFGLIYSLYKERGT